MGSGIRVGGARRVLEAAPADDQLAGVLEVERLTPLVFIESVSWDSSFRPFDCYRAWVRTDRLKIEIQASLYSGAGSLTSMRRLLPPVEQNASHLASAQQAEHHAGPAAARKQQAEIPPSGKSPGPHQVPRWAWIRQVRLCSQWKSYRALMWSSSRTNSLQSAGGVDQGYRSLIKEVTRLL